MSRLAGKGEDGDRNDEDFKEPMDGTVGKANVDISG